MPRAARQRARSTRLTERNPVRGKRSVAKTNGAKGKGPKPGDRRSPARTDNPDLRAPGSDEPKWERRLRVLANLENNDKAQGLFRLMNEIDL